MKRLLLGLLLSFPLVSCGGADSANQATATTETAGETAAKTTTADRAVESVTRAQAKAREIAAEENERTQEVD
ncbi:MAG TPA: hypothetical protein VGF40_09960, partial [Thermoanaerobaculia bacterium]